MIDNVRILIIDDEEKIRNILRMYLEIENYTVDEADNGETALHKSMHKDYDLIILDLTIPLIDGFNVCQKIREKKTTPIIILTCRGDESDLIKSFESGADEYIVKPFSPKELILRIKAILRRCNINMNPISNPEDNMLIFPHLTIDKYAHRVEVDDQEVSLTPKEYDLLLYLSNTPEKVFDREQLLKEVWKYDFFGDLRTVDTHIKRLREKLNSKSRSAAKMIVTVWGIGYKLEVNPRI